MKNLPPSRRLISSHGLKNADKHMAEKIVVAEPWEWQPRSRCFVCAPAEHPEPLDRAPEDVAAELGLSAPKGSLPAEHPETGEPGKWVLLHVDPDVPGYNARVNGPAVDGLRDTPVVVVAESLQDGGEREAQDKLIERVRAALRPLGYAVALHGSRVRDLDLIAAPWVEDAEHEPMAVYRALRAAGFREVGMGALASPHGRLGFAIHGVGSAGIEYLDLSVLLPSRHPHQDAERAARRIQLEVERLTGRLLADHECGHIACMAFADAAGRDD